MALPSQSGKRLKFVAILIPFLALSVVWLLSTSLLYQRVDRWLCDQQQYRVAESFLFDDAVFLDIDDDTILELKSEFGVWPYNRDIYSLVLDYLTERGVKTVVFDILFLERRDGDQAFVESIKRNGNVVFAMREPAFWSEYQDLHENKQLLNNLSWPVSVELPVRSLDTALLPVSDFIRMDPPRYNVGSIDTKPDFDGVVRRIPYVYKVGESYLPSLPIVVQNLHNEQKQIRYNAGQGAILMGDHIWPVSADGMMGIYYPKNLDFVKNLSFYEVVRAAQGLDVPENAGYFFRGKTVFIGSTAFKLDRANTPRGLMPGTYLLSLIYENLKHDLVIKSSSPLWDGLWVVLGLLVLLSSVFCPGYCPWKYGLLVCSAMGFVVYGNGLLFALYRQPSSLLLPLLTMTLGYILYVLFFGLLLKKQNVALLEEKNELEMVNEALELKANTDPLTGMLNRGAYLALFEHEIERFKRTGATFTVAIMDLDFFKKVNDTYGHDIGDDVLRNCAEVLKTTKRELDVVARWGGEEFVIFFPDTDIEGAQTACNKIRQAIGVMKTPIPQGDLQVTMSMGIAEFNDLAMSPERCIAKADKALYAAKEEGRNRVYIRK